MKANLLILFLFLSSTIVANQGPPPKRPVHITAVIASYNNERWCIKNLNSLKIQRYPNWDVVYINDCSTDQTGAIVDNYVINNNLKNKFSIIHNNKRMGSLANIYRAISQIEPHHVVALIDGDDWLADGGVFEHIARVYQDPNIWLTYGNFSYDPPQKYGSHCFQFPKHIIENNRFRYFQFTSGHLKTFYAGLFHKIKREDLLDVDGKFLPSAGDVGFMIPMLEMARHRIRFISKNLYVYNIGNPINDVHNLPLQLRCNDLARSRPRYQPLTTATWRN